MRCFLFWTNIDHVTISSACVLDAYQLGRFTVMSCSQHGHVHAMSGQTRSQFCHVFRDICGAGAGGQTRPLELWIPLQLVAISNGDRIHWSVLIRFISKMTMKVVVVLACLLALVAADIYKRDIYKRDIYKRDIYKRDIYKRDIYKRDAPIVEV